MALMNHSQYKETLVQARYVTNEVLQKNWYTKLSNISLSVIGQSEEGEEIASITLGRGSKKVLMWSQMHGNESTTTKAALDLVNFLSSKNELAKIINDNCTITLVPILNPDGAKRYTRANANNIDLNRDAKLLSQLESQALRKLFEAFGPDYCFNLHDQRTLFSAGNAKKPATISFLSPASDPERKMNPTRESAMKLIVAMNQELQKEIPGQVGRYDDGFNDNCVGDFFQMKKVPTILFEAGHYPNDYEREKTREYIFHSLIEALKVIAENRIHEFRVADYFKIPENEKRFYDILVKNPQEINPDLTPNVSVGIRFKEVLETNRVLFEPEIVDVAELNGYFGHETFDCSLKNDVEQLHSRKEILNLIVNSKN
ncbi:DUF2817 domain-containing protein [Flagellimonas hymeniacidonis]|uniref:DUF2817 domain-containing protein n=2 Tax=Flagellimonas hymeniacidonis TaxID=2603628 RepID=A0A5C8V4X9_9FLAO|nr:DUF2817 domain-containing protein [Flagellimonas hymeniacidonis]